LIVYYHDECIFWANDGEVYFWGEEGDVGHATKSQGQGIMISDFICDEIGYLQLTETQYQDYLEKRKVNAQLPELQNRRARIVFEYGKNKMGYWGSEHFRKQIQSAMIIHNILFPNYQALFVMDNSSGHLAFAPDALDASKMNVNPGGKQPKIRTTEWNGKPQEIGQRGLKAVLLERELITPGEKVNKDEMVRRLKECRDFKEEKPIVLHDIEAKGHLGIFLPKYHCELNPIERVWCQAKRKVREVCDYSFKSLKENVEKCLDDLEVSLIRKFCRHCREYLRAYGEGADSEGLMEKKKVYKSHRRVYVPK